jgi:hypothetical protein
MNLLNKWKQMTHEITTQWVITDISAKRQRDKVYEMIEWPIQQQRTMMIMETCKRTIKKSQGQIKKIQCHAWYTMPFKQQMEVQLRFSPIMGWRGGGGERETKKRDIRNNMLWLNWLVQVVGNLAPNMQLALSNIIVVKPRTDLNNGTHRQTEAPRTPPTPIHNKWHVASACRHNTCFW